MGNAFRFAILFTAILATGVPRASHAEYEATRESVSGYEVPDSRTLNGRLCSSCP